MLPSRARWTIGQAEEEIAQALSSQLSIAPILAQLLVSRGFHTVEAAELFLRADMDHLHDPFLFDGMDLAVQRIRQALASREKIRIYGDYDADGVSSTALLVRLMRSLEAEFDYYIPHRVREGYGLNREAMDKAKEAGVALLITVDTGISAVEEIAYARVLGLDVVVTDHHEPPERLPDATAIINPKKPGCPYPFKQLAGAGVALKLAQALLGRVPEEWMDIAAIGTVGDLMPLTDENRIIVKHGLKRMSTSTYAGIKALLEVSGIDKGPVTAGNIGFSLAPRINASGRLDSADDAVELLITDQTATAKALATTLDQVNQERQNVVDGIVEQAFVQAEGLNEQADKEKAAVLVVAGSGWNVGVVGIVASKLLDRFFRPTIVLSIDSDTGLAKGSARSIPGFDIHRALTLNADLLMHYGGHPMAAGMTLQVENIPLLRERLQQLAEEWLTEADYVPVLNADLECQLEGQPLTWIRELEKLAPFGIGNPAPRFMFAGLRVVEKKQMGKDNRHLKLQVSPPPGSGKTKPLLLDAVGFGKGHLEGDISTTSPIHLLGELSINEWNGMEKPQLIIQDMHIPGTQVFDYRNATLQDKRWQLLANRREPVGLVFSTPDEARSVATAGFGPLVSKWVYSPGNDQMHLVDATEEGPIAYRELGQLVLYSLPLSMAAFAAALRQAEAATRIYAVFKEPVSGDDSLPGKEMFKQVYGLIRQGDGWKRSGMEPDVYISRRTGLSPHAVRFIIEVFEELQFVERASGDYLCMPVEAKRDLAESMAYQNRQHQADVEHELLYSTAQELTTRILALRNP